MVVQNNPTPWISFALFTAVLCGVLGLMLGLNPFGPSQEIRDEAARTQLAVGVRLTENAVRVSETPQAVIVAQTAQAGQLTSMPNQQVATHLAGQEALEGARMNATQGAVVDQIRIGNAIAQATQTSVAQSLYLNEITGNATATAIAREQTQQQAAGPTGMGVAVLIVLTFSGWLAVRSFAQVTAARAQDKAAQAKLLAEQRRLLSLRASIRTQREERDQRYPIPSSLMKKSNDGKDLPRAE